jgi:hypothetical protein
LLRDDGAVIYLNGVKLSHSNMPSGTITAETLAISDVDGSSEDKFYGRLYSVDGLVPGNNIIAVEVHQSSGDSEDLSFDLGLEATANKLTGISEIQRNIPQDFILFEPYPNPFNPTSTIRYQMPEACYVKLNVYDIMGRKVSTLVDEHQVADRYHVEFDAVNLASGIYFYQIQMGTFTDTKKLILQK